MSGILVQYRTGTQPPLRILCNNTVYIITQKKQSGGNMVSVNIRWWSKVIYCWLLNDICFFFPSTPSMSIHWTFNFSNISNSERWRESATYFSYGLKFFQQSCPRLWKQPTFHTWKIRQKYLHFFSLLAQTQTNFLIYSEVVMQTYISYKSYKFGNIS